MFDKPQTQSQDGSGIALQAGQDITITLNRGMSYQEVRSIALDVSRANLLEFQGVAMQMAQARAEVVTEKFLEKLRVEHIQGLQQAQTPDFQDALFTVQKEYAKAGDEELGDLLVDLLVDRTKQVDRNLMQLVLNEALHTAPKLPGAQVATLSIIFLLRSVRFYNSATVAMLADNIKKHLSPVFANYTTNPSTFAHLAFTSCGTAVTFDLVSLEQIWLSEFPGLFKTGFDRARLDAEQVDPAIKSSLVMRCLNDPTKLQLSAVRPNVLDEQLGKLNASAEDAVKMRALYAEAAMSQEQVKEKMVAVDPFFEDVFKAWNSTPMNAFSLTSVGMAIGHANIKRHVGEFSPLSIWVN